MDKAFTIVIPNEVRNLVFSKRDCRVASPNGSLKRIARFRYDYAEGG